jgi:hypothetical protein
MSLAKDGSKFVETRTDEETVVMALDTGEFFSLQDTARAIWELIDGTSGRETIIASLAAKYSVDPAAIAPEVDAFLGELQAKRLLRQS